MQTKEYHNKKWLTEQYLVKGRSTVSIGKECGVAAWTINTWLRKYGIKIRPSNSRVYLDGKVYPSKYKITKEYLQKQYMTRRKTLNQIASELGCSWDTVRKQIIKNGFPMRNKTASNRGGNRRTTTEVRRFQKKCLRKYGYRCIVCGYDKFVNAHHIEPWASTKNDDVGNGIILCPNHHAEADYGVLTEEELRKYQQDTVRTMQECIEPSRND